MSIHVGNSKGQNSGASQQAESVEEARLPNRRSFFSRLALDAATSLCTYQVASRLVQSVDLAPDPPRHEGQQGPRKYPYTNVPTQLAPGVSFQNLGVCHTSGDFLRDRGVLLQEIHRADVVLLEGFAGQNYFDYLAALAHESGKAVVRLEGDLSLIPSIALTYSPLASALVAYSNTSHYLDRLASAIAKKPENFPSTDPSGRRATLTMLTCFFSETFRIFPVPEDFKKYPADDWSHIVDGRTVIMLGEISKFATNNKNLSIVAITGDAHARGFRFYTSSPENQKLFEKKLDIYQKVYKSWLGGNAILEQDPAKQ